MTPTVYWHTAAAGAFFRLAVGGGVALHYRLLKRFSLFFEPTVISAGVYATTFDFQRGTHLERKPLQYLLGFGAQYRF